MIPKLIKICIAALTLFNFVTAKAWTCNEETGFCTEQASGFSTYMKAMDAPKQHDSQELCRLVCGTHRGLWPLPTGLFVLGKTYVPFKADNLVINLDYVPEPLRIQASKVVSIFKQKLTKPTFRRSYGPQVKSTETVDLYLTLNVGSPDTSLNADTDEQYDIFLTTGANGRIEGWVNATTIYGSRHGLETLFQLTAEYPGTGGQRAILSSVIIQDKPIYKHRGLLLDTARNFFPTRYIRETLDGMAASKLNVFHWHITDAQSFSLEVEGYPQFTKYGAYASDKVYSIADVEGIVRYAKNRGIRVIIEIDAPAHAGLGWQWGRDAGLGDLAVCVNKQPWAKYCIQPPCGQLNPVNSRTILLLKEVYKTVQRLNPNEMLHMGGDEVHLGCWNSTPEIVHEMQQRGYPQTKEGFLTLWSEFQQAALEALDEVTGDTQAKTILWSSELTDPEHIKSYLPKERYIIQTWVPKEDNLTSTLLELGYELIISTKNAWYLDHGFWGYTNYYSWKTVYSNKILADYRVLGGEVCMWGEFVGPESLHARVWPRAAAFAERLWADPITHDFNYVEVRLNAQRKRLLDLGLTPDALKPEWCLINEGECLNYNMYN